MHSCKGLEFPHVFIVGLEDGLLPHTRSKTEGTLDEERRLFYVAITRAQKTLSITHCQGRKNTASSSPAIPPNSSTNFPKPSSSGPTKKPRNPFPLRRQKPLRRPPRRDRRS